MTARTEALRSAWHTFLQTACGVLFAWIAGATTGLIAQQPAWKAAALALAASLIAAGLAWVMNQNKE